MASSHLTIGLLQFDIAWENPERNFKRLEVLLDTKPKLDLLILPEMWSTGFTMNPTQAAEQTPGSALHWMTSMAAQLNTTIMGSISIGEGNLYYNRLYCTYPNGQIDHYDKKHLFSHGTENLHYTPGTKSQSFDIKGWKIKPIICYDLRFPAWCRNTDNYDLMVVVANWPEPRIHHWDALLKARAIENQSYVAAVNRIGSDGNDLKYNGHSAVYDMNGADLLDLSDKEGLKTILLDKEALSTFRNQFRFLQDRDHFSF